MFHTVVQRGFLKRWQKYYIYFVYNLLLFPTVKEFSKSVNIWWSYCKNSTARFFRHRVFYCCQTIYDQNMRVDRCTV